MSDIYLWRVKISKKYHDEEIIHSWARDKDEAIVHALNQILDLNHKKVLSRTAHDLDKLMVVGKHLNCSAERERCPTGTCSQRATALHTPEKKVSP